MAPTVKYSIRPVEVLWLRTHRGTADGWTQKNVLQAVLMDLAVRGVLELNKNENRGNKFKPTKKIKDTESLRDYEIDIYRMVKKETDENAMANVVYEFDFEEFFIEQGFLKIVEDSKEVVETDAYDNLMVWVDEQFARLATDVSNSSVSTNMLPWLWAFPDTKFLSVDNPITG